MVALVKPQFEAGKGRVGKKGVVRDAVVHADVLRSVATPRASARAGACAGSRGRPSRGPRVILSSGCGSRATARRRAVDARRRRACGARGTGRLTRRARPARPEQREPDAPSTAARELAAWLAADGHEPRCSPRTPRPLRARALARGAGRGRHARPRRSRSAATGRSCKAVHLLARRRDARSSA